MPIDIRREPLSMVVRDHPGWRPILESFGIDGRHGDDITLAAAADRAGADVPAVVAALSGSSGARYDCGTIARAPIGALIEHITTVHHTLLRRELPRIGVLIEDAMLACPTDTRLVDLDNVFRVLRADLEPHLDLEEAVVFPMCRDIAEAFSWPSFHCGPVARPIEIVTHDHDHAIGALEELAWIGDDLRRRPVGRWVATVEELELALRRLDADVQRHFDEEHALLFPRTLRFAEELRLI